MNEVVKYHNNMNTVALRKFNSLEMDIFMSICSRLKEKNEEIIEFSFDDIKKLAKIESDYTIEQFGKIIDNVYEKLLKTNIRIGDDKEWTRFVLFTEYTISTSKQNITIGVNKKFSWVLNELTAKFTRFELEEYIDFKSSYTKEFFRRMKQYRATGIWKISLEDFKTQLDIPKSYATHDIDKAVLSPILKELKKDYKLKIKKTYEIYGKGRPKLSGFEFRFLTEETKQKKDQNESMEQYKQLSIPTKFGRRKIYNIISNFEKDNKIWLKLEDDLTKEIEYKTFEHIIHYTNFIMKYAKKR